MKRILIVDASAHMRRYACGILTASGYAVVEAADSSAARAVLNSTAIDVLITDIDLPDVDGMGLIQCLVAEGGPRLVACSAEIEKLAAAERKVVDDFAVTLTKPFHPRTLLEVVALAIG